MVSKTFASSLRKELRAAVTELGADHVARVKSAATSEGLHRAADAVYIRPNFSLKSAGVRIVVSRAKAPYARPMEMGNQGGSESETTFRNGKGGVQAKRPFFFGTLKKLEPMDEAAFVTAADIICREAGFR